MEKFIKDRIEENNSEIRALKQENRRLEKELEENGNIKDVFKWEGYVFESSSLDTKEFLAFVRDFKKYIKSNLPKDSNLTNFSRGHFDVSGFIEKNGKYVYFSTSDVRYSPDEWINDILIRTAKDDKDYTGGSNDSTTLKDFKKNIERLIGGDK